MKIQILQGNANDFDQITIEEEMEKKDCKLEILYETDNHKDALYELIQWLNDENLDIVNNFHTIREIK